MFKLQNTGTGEYFYATTLSAGFDICAAEYVVIKAHTWCVIKTGLSIIETDGEQEVIINNIKHILIPEIQIRPRSGLAAKYGITVLNSPSTIDADYRGEMRVNLINHGQDDFVVNVGDRIAQGVCAFIIRPPSISVKNVTRGVHGFGSTGISTHLNPESSL